MDKKLITTIFSEHKLATVEYIEKIEIGFTNKVYSINDKFILKVCDDESNEVNFEKEVFFYEFFKYRLPVPQIIVVDNTKKISDKHYFVYKKIDGSTLYEKWHLMNSDERDYIIKQLTDILKIINKSDFKEFARRFNIDTDSRWQEIIVFKINKSLSEIKRRNLLSIPIIKEIKKFVDLNKEFLSEQQMALVYWDAHFDNVLVQNNKIVGILDFERTELASIDFVLDIIRRMMEQPTKYMSEASEQFAKKSDYEDLLQLFNIHYPELFKFENINRRLDLYSIEHDLKDIVDWPNVSELKEQIMKIIR